MKKSNLQSDVPARYWHRLDDNRIQCDLCPRDCKLHEGQRGLCFVRQCKNSQMVLTTYGRSSGFCIDPIEKKPLNHFYPGSSVLSFGTAGCNLSCRYCQNWDISKSREFDRLCDSASPMMIAETARAYGSRSVAFTYNDPVIFLEYAVDTARACRRLGLHTVAVTAGYIHAEAAREFFAHMDAVNVDLKSFSEAFYHRLCAGHLQPVLDTLVYIHEHTECWLEITTLLIPGYNDDMDEIRHMCQWIIDHLGMDVPLHFTAFHPDWKMTDTPPTPSATLQQARHIAMKLGMHYVYTGNVHDSEGGSTLCPGCGKALIVRDWYNILRFEITEDGHCPYCRHTITGHFDRMRQAFGNRRIPVRLHET